MQGLSDKQPGGADQTFKWILHTSGDNIAAGAHIGDGDGNPTGLVLYSEKIGIKGPTNTATIAFTGATDQAFSLPPVGGVLMTGDVTTVELAANANVTDSVLTAVANFEFTPAASGKYQFEMWLLVSSSNAGHGYKLSIEGAAGQVDTLAWTATLPAGAGSVSQTHGSVFGVTLSTGAVAAADTPQLVHVRGVMHSNATTQAVPVSLKIANENGASTTILHAGSSMRFEKL